MKPIERMKAIQAGRMPDRWPFVPSIYEHGAAVIGRTPAEVSCDAGLMADAAIEAWRAYQHDLVTVGINIYNIEAEAFGCRIQRDPTGPFIPGVVSHPLGGVEDMPDCDALPVPRPGPDNRLGLIAEAVRKVQAAIGEQVWVYACTGGPFSQAVELRGFNEFIIDAALNPRAVHRLMARTTQLAMEHADRLSREGVGVYLYESWATMPLIDPPLFEQFVVPYNRQVIDMIRQRDPTPPPAIVMGGNVSLLVGFFLDAHSGLVVCDFNADFDMIRSHTDGKGIMVRGCVDPKQIERGDWEKLQPAISTLARKARGMTNFLWGCGCVPYHTPARHVLRFKEMCLTAATQVAGGQ